MRASVGSRFRLPLLALLALVAIHLAVHVPDGPTAGVRLLRFGALDAPRVAAGEVWRLWTYSLLHAGAVHLAANGFSLLLVGGDAVLLFGRSGFLFLFTVSSIGGGIVSLRFSGAESLSVGASAGIFGLFGAACLSLVRLRDHVTPERWRRAAMIAFAVLGVNVAIGFHPNIGQAAHLGGLGTGALASMLLSFRFDPRSPVGGRPLLLLRTLGGASVLSYVAALAWAAGPVRSGESVRGERWVSPAGDPPAGIALDLPPGWRRQEASGRWVAADGLGNEVQVIVEGDGADPLALARFRRETEARDALDATPVEDFSLPGWSGHVFRVRRGGPEGGTLLNVFVGRIGGRTLTLLYFCSPEDWPLLERSCWGIVRSLRAEE